jgi:hypothetical protein
MIFGSWVDCRVTLPDRGRRMQREQSQLQAVQEVSVIAG